MILSKSTSSFLSMRLLWLTAFGLLVLGGSVPRATGQEAAAPQEAGAFDFEFDLSLAGIEEQLVRLRERRENARASENGGVDPVAFRELDQEIQILESFQGVLEEGGQEEERRAALAEEIELARAEATKTPAERAEHEPPFTLSEFDGLLDRRDALLELQRTLEQSVEEQEAILEEAAEAVEEGNRSLRELEENLATAEGAEVSALRRRGRLERLTLTLRERTQALLQAEVENDRSELEGVQLQTQGLEEFAAWMRTHLDLSPVREREDQIQIETEETEVEKELEQARAALRRADARWARASATGDSESLRAILSAAQQKVKALEERQQRLGVRREALGIRYQWLRDPFHERGVLEEYSASMLDLLETLQRQERRRESDLLEARTASEELQGRLLADSGVEATLRERADLQAALVDFYEGDLAGIVRDLSRVERPRAAIEQRLSEVSPLDRLRRMGDSVDGFWATELLVVEDSPITVGKLLSALILLILGTWASRRLSRLFSKRILDRFQLDEGVVAALQTVTFYLLFLAFFLWALRLVGIPLTVFTFLGGAVAIGVGFGSQNIVNNFMSGLILMAERPVKVGDLVEVDGTPGRVDYIGARSTRIRAGDNTHLIVPNSILLESKVQNWTLADNMVRTSMDVGVAYGSDLAEVRRQIEAALGECDRILESPASEILFVDFAADALLFRTLFWVRLRQPMDRDRAQSQLRFQIDQRFREAGISIAFPQRDLHLEKPIEVRLRHPGDD